MRRDRIERSRYAQIALTYTKPWPLRIWAAGVAIGMLWIVIAAMIAGANDDSVRMGALFFCGSAAAWLGAMIAGHAKEQLGDARASLVPGFRTPHLVIATVMFLVLVVGLACVVAWGEVWVPGYLGIVLAITALLAWMGQLQTPSLIILGAAVVTPVFFADGRALFTDVLRGRAAGVGYAVLAASVAALVGLWWRLAVMSEEMPEYGRGGGVGLRLKVRMTGDPAFQRENAAGASRIESFVRQARRFDAVPNIAAAGFWPRAGHWRFVIGTGRMPIFVALVLGLWVPLLQATTTKPDVGIIVALVSASFVPGLMFAATWPRRWYVLGDESLRPASRRQFIREHGAAMAMEYAITWAWITAAPFASAVLFASWPQRVFEQLMVALPMMAAVQALIFAILVWILRFRAGWLVIVPIFLVTGVGVAALIVGAAIAEARNVNAAMLFTLLVAVAGVGITLDAYRRWLVTEFD